MTPAGTPRLFDPAHILERLRTLVRDHEVLTGGTQADFARRAGVSQSQLSHWLSGNYTPDLASIARIASGANVSAEWLIFGAGPKYAQDVVTQAPGATHYAIRVAGLLQSLGESLRRHALDENEHEVGLLDEVILEHLSIQRPTHAISRTRQRAG